ncbi:MAG: FAD-dependent thymidylate synthase [Gemmatimonadota bacterium]|nr:MAG: FAD-dependent thymidylate synthase [Gemmatimonadota bacterium]
MEIILAGYNIDTDVLHEMMVKAGDRQDATPETLSAAYARISRSPEPVNELRRAAREEVEKSRKSNRNIIFGMGHHSVAEHAVFNFDIMGVSRLAIEEIEKFRLNSYTEKSQRYITLGDDFVIPKEILDSPFRDIFVDTVKSQNRLYHKLYETLKTHVFEKHSDIAQEKKNRSILDGWAKEDARYVTSLATEGQLGATLNARNLELLFRRFASHELSEVREIGEKMFRKVEKVAPSIILFTEANDHDQKTYPALRNLAVERMERDHSDSQKFLPDDVTMVNHTADADNISVATLLHTSTHQPFAQCLDRTRKMSFGQKREMVKAACQHMELYDSALREFEYVDATFDLIVSASCFAQLKRHRMVTLTCQGYDPELHVTIPESITATGMEKDFLELITKTEDVYKIIHRQLPAIAPYILTNAHRKRVLLKVNARELYHMSRLRQDATAQWDIRQLTGRIVAQAKDVMPLTLLIAGGKDEYPQIYEDVYGHSPKVMEAELPT